MEKKQILIPRKRDESESLKWGWKKQQVVFGLYKADINIREGILWLSYISESIMSRSGSIIDHKRNRVLSSKKFYELHAWNKKDF